MLLLQSFLSPSHPKAIVTPWLLVAVPLCSFLLSQWVTIKAASPTVNNQPVTHPTAAMEHLQSSRIGAGEYVPWGSRFQVAVAGLLVMIGVTWWEHYASSHPLWDLRWIYDLGYILTHWGMQEVPPPVLTVLLLIFLWLNGMGDAVRAMTHDDVWGALVRSVTAIVLFVILLNIAGRPLPNNIYYLIILLFGVGMLALAFSSLKITVGLDRALGLGQRRITATPSISRYWLSSVLITVGGLLGLGLLVAVLLAPEQLASLLDAAAAVIRSIGYLLGQLLLAISYVLFVIFYFFFRLIEPLLQRIMERMADSPLVEMLSNMENTEQMEQIAEGSAPLPDSYRWMGLAIGIGLVLIAFALAVRRLRTVPAAVEDEIRESILTTDLLQEQLSGLWRRWFGRRRSPTDPFLSLAEEAPARRRIRAIYQQLLAGAATVGAARTPAETPGEYAEHLRHQFPIMTSRHSKEYGTEHGKEQSFAHGRALATITAAYHQARYAPNEPDQNMQGAVEAAWTQVASHFEPHRQADGNPSDLEAKGGSHATRHGHKS